MSGVRPLSHSGAAGQGCKAWLLSGWSESHEERILGVRMYSKSGAISAGQRRIAEGFEAWGEGREAKRRLGDQVRAGVVYYSQRMPAIAASGSA